MTAGAASVKQSLRMVSADLVLEYRLQEVFTQLIRVEVEIVLGKVPGLPP